MFGPRAPSGLLVSAFVAGGLASACGCGKEHGPAVVFTQAVTDWGEPTDGVYHSSPAGRPWLFFPGGRKYRLAHGLGRAPETVDGYFGDQEHPTEWTPASGDAFLVLDATEAYLDVWNDTCAEFYLRVVAE